MNNLIVFVTLLVVCLGCAHGSIYCYYCANCPIPFKPNAPGVTVVTSPTNFCTKQARSATDPYAPNSRGAAAPGLCVVPGCRWAYDPSGQQIWVCCCNGNYCNANM